MESKNGTPRQSLRTSDRLRKRPKYYSKGFLYYQAPLRKKMKPKKRTAASQIAKKILSPRKPSVRAIPPDVSIVNFPFHSGK
jgi:ATPase family AAA domain-containing protein 2